MKEVPICIYLSFVSVLNLHINTIHGSSFNRSNRAVVPWKVHHSPWLPVSSYYLIFRRIILLERMKGNKLCILMVISSLYMVLVTLEFGTFVLERCILIQENIEILISETVRIQKLLFLYTLILIILLKVICDS